MIRLAVDANCLAWGWGGIPKYVARVTAELARSGDYDITLLTNSRGAALGIDGVTHVERRLRGGTLWRNAVVAPWLRRHRPDVFWAPETVAPLWVGVPMVITVHDLAALTMPDVKPMRLRVSYRVSVRRAATEAARVIAVSASTARDVERLWHVPPDRVRVIPDAVDDRFTVGDRAGALARVVERWGVSAPFGLCVGSIEPRKGLDVAVQAAGLARAAGSPWQLVIAGDRGHRADDVIATAAATGACRLLGRVTDDELVDLYRAADAVLVPSWYEGFGMTALEAMACGTPAVIAAASGGLEEVSGPAAVVVAERTAEAWWAGIRAASDRRAELVTRGLELAGRYRWPAVAAETGEVLAEAADRSRSR
ncbi:MAG: AprM [Acidimicrobiales bacterium]|nr:AprM [Acidimicrobiales bacterium]